MVISKKEQIFEIGKIILVLFTLFLVLKWLIPVLTSAGVKAFVERLGLFGPLVVIGYTVLSHILVPMAGTPGILLSVAIFGLYQTVFYIYLGSLVSSIINFWIARKFGRKWVERLAGSKAMREIDDFVKAFGIKLLVLARIFGFTLFEVVSYATGFTKIDFKKYFFITVVYTLIPSLIFTFLFRNADFSSPTSLVIWLSTLIIMGLAFAAFIKRYLNKRRKLTKEK